MPEAKSADVCASCCQIGALGTCRISCGIESHDLSSTEIIGCTDSLFLMINDAVYWNCNNQNTECLFSTTTTTTSTTPSTTTTTVTQSTTTSSTSTTTLADPGYVSGGFRNIYSVLQLNASNDELSDPVHNMSEYAFFNRSSIYGSGGSNVLDSGSVVYMINAGYIPMDRLVDAATGKYLDYGYRGKILIFGKEYYVREIDANKLYACNGSIKQTDNLGFFGDYMSYKFKVDHLIYGPQNAVFGVVLDVRRPDGAIVQSEISANANGLVDSLEIRMLNFSLSGSRTGVQMLIYDLESELILQDKAPYSIGGLVNNEWIASFITVEQPLPGSVSIPLYQGIGPGQKLLANISIVFSGSKNLSTGDNLSMPSGYKVICDGSDVIVVNYSACDLIGDTEPCGAISLQEIIDHINKWSISRATLSQLIALINRWAGQ